MSYCGDRRLPLSCATRPGRHRVTGRAQHTGARAASDPPRARARARTQRGARAPLASRAAGRDRRRENHFEHVRHGHFSDCDDADSAELIWHTVTAASHTKRTGLPWTQRYTLIADMAASGDVASATAGNDCAEVACGWSTLVACSAQLEAAEPYEELSPGSESLSERDNDSCLLWVRGSSSSDQVSTSWTCMPRIITPRSFPGSHGP